MYPAELVQPMRDELTAVGFDELADASAVDVALAKEGTTLVVVN
jgi:putative YphP/YqiW family bacilliredoxin